MPKVLNVFFIKKLMLSILDTHTPDTNHVLTAATKYYKTTPPVFEKTLSYSGGHPRVRV